MSDQPSSKIPNPRGKKPGERRLGQRPASTMAMWYVLAFVLLLAVVNVLWFSLQWKETIPYSEFKSYIREGRIAELTVGSDRVRGKFIPPPPTGRQEAFSA